MHHSRLAGFIIDCRTDDLNGAADFWSKALGMPPKARQDATQPIYVNLESDARDLHIEVQQVEHESRLHLDIESDDIDAEVARLEKLGARRLAKVRTWVVMEAPTGQRFCVVRANPARIAIDGNRWEGEASGPVKPAIPVPQGTVGTASDGCDRASCQPAQGCDPAAGAGDAGDDHADGECRAECAEALFASWGNAGRHAH